MPLTQTADTVTLAEFDRRNSPSGLLKRYARGRIMHFAPRQIAVVVGGIALAILVSPLLGFGAAVLAFLGEAVDCEILRRVPAWLDRGVPLRRLKILTTITAGFQGFTLAACVFLAQLAAVGGEASLFAFSYLAAAVLNAGVVMNYHRGAGRARIGIYAVTAIAAFAAEIHSGENEAGLIYDAVGLAMIGFISFVFLRFVGAAQEDRTRQSRKLLEGQAALEKAYNDLKKSQTEVQKLALAMQHATDSIILFSPVGRIVWVNEGFTRMKGYTASEAIGRYPGQLFHAPDTDPLIHDRIGRELRNGQPYRAVIANQTKDGRKIWVDASIVPLLGPDGEIQQVVATERDITEEKARAQELADAKERAEEGARAKAAFLATMSHEIRTPMNGIIGMADLLSETHLAQDQKLYAETIRSSAEALLKIINDILDYSKLEADKMIVEQEPFSLAACLRNASGILRQQALDKGLYLDVCHETPLPEQVVGDSGRLRQILLNLLGNAVKFTESGGVSMTSAVTRHANGYLLTVRVQDTGIGIPEERAEQIFQQFEQADTESTRRFGGTGLGLAISRELARRMGGDLRLEPQTGKGSCFLLTVPLAHASTAVSATAEAPRSKQQDRLPPMRILVAEDNRTNRLVIQRFLSDQPVEIVEAENGRQAIELLQKHVPDVVLMDMSMPLLDGLDATRLIRSGAGPQPKIVALTANAFDSDRDACFAAGMDDFLSKPLRRDELISALARAAPENPLCPAPSDDLSKGSPAIQGAPPWTSPHESGITSGRSTRSSGR